MPSDESTNFDLAQLLAEADQDFVTRSAQRMEMGAEKYGPIKFLSVDTFEEAMQELLDLNNYTRMLYIKLYLLRESTTKLTQKHPAADAQGFVSTREMFGAPDRQNEV